MSNPFDVLAARVDALSRQTRASVEILAEVRQIAEATQRVLDDLVDRVAAAEQLAAGAVAAAAKPGPAGGLADVDERPIVSWLAEPHADALPELADWIDRVLIHYPGTTEALSSCWPFHPWVVEELVALHTAWIEAYEGERASGAKAVDWHDRYRPDTVGRIHATVGDCSADAHAPGRRADHRKMPSRVTRGDLDWAWKWWACADRAQ